MAKKINFRSKAAYRKWLAYNWIHNRSKMGRKPHKVIRIHGRPHRVRHRRK